MFIKKKSYQWPSTYSNDLSGRENFVLNVLKEVFKKTNYEIAL